MEPAARGDLQIYVGINSEQIGLDICENLVFSSHHEFGSSPKQPKAVIREYNVGHSKQTRLPVCQLLVSVFGCSKIRLASGPGFWAQVVLQEVRECRWSRLQSTTIVKELVLQAEVWAICGLQRELLAKTGEVTLVERVVLSHSNARSRLAALS